MICSCLPKRIARFIGLSESFFLITYYILPILLHVYETVHVGKRAHRLKVFFSCKQVKIWMKYINWTEAEVWAMPAKQSYIQQEPLLYSWRIIRTSKQSALTSWQCNTPGNCHQPAAYQWFQSLFRCRIATLNFPMGFNITAPFMDCVTHK